MSKDVNVKDADSFGHTCTYCKSFWLYESIDVNL